MRTVQFAASLLVILQASGLEAADDNLFADRIVPLLEKKCIRCHNDSEQKGELSLQDEKSTRAGGESGEVLDLEAPGDSLLLEYVRGPDPEMPKDGEPLTDEEIAVLEKWIAAGAEWPGGRQLEDKSLADLEWWSLAPVRRPRLPTIDERLRARAKSPIDYFIFARHQEKDLQMSDEADHRTLIRRVYFDLVGLPPAPEEIERFCSDSSPTAYEDLVDRLLASPGYGERWARHWLDVVKYADTCGYDKDKLRPNAWPYRDYVIRSFNDDKKYERFVKEQLAGDILFPGTPDGILGLGFIAAGPWDFIGHVEVPETKIDGRVARHIDRDEMVTNTLNSFASVTVQCARCHNHKFDPITQRDYYRLQAVFAAVDRAERPYDLDPDIEKQRYEYRRVEQEARQKLAGFDQELWKEGGQPLSDAHARITELTPKAGLAGKDPAFGYHSNIEKQSDLTKWVQIDLGESRRIKKVILRPCHDEFNGINGGFGFPVRFKVEAGNDASFTSSGSVVLLEDRTAEDFANPGLAPVSISSDGVSARFVRVTATKLATRKDDFIMALAELQVFGDEETNIASGAAVTAIDSIEAPVRWAASNLTDGKWAVAKDDEVALRLFEAKRERKAILNRLYTLERTKIRADLEETASQAKSKLEKLPRGRMVYAAATDFTPQAGFQPTRGKPRTIRVLHRGNIQDPGETVGPGTLRIGHTTDGELRLPGDASEGRVRASLANWLTSRDHPLAWRSIVNRIWQYHFGAGIVETPNDFGRMGQRPSHPDLLDWLAADFRDNGQSIKRLHRLIVTSATYRQVSTFSEKNSKIDSGNRYLWRMNRRRLEAEAIRDTILAISGQLDTRMGGPGYYLFVLEKTDHSPHYEYHKFDPNDRESHRRTVYRFIVRSQPDPFMTTLDCADSSQSTPRRDETLTSLQALSLLNNRFNLAMAARMASRLESEGGSIHDQVQRAMQLATGRSPSEGEQIQMVAYAEKHGLANFCRIIFNLSEFMYLD